MITSDAPQGSVERSVAWTLDGEAHAYYCALINSGQADAAVAIAQSDILYNAAEKVNQEFLDGRPEGTWPVAIALALLLDERGLKNVYPLPGAAAGAAAGARF